MSRWHISTFFFSSTLNINIKVLFDLLVDCLLEFPRTISVESTDMNKTQNFNPDKIRLERLLAM